MNPKLEARSEGGLPPRSYYFVEAMRGCDGLLRTLNSDGCWEEWVPVKQAAHTVAKLLFALLVTALSSFLFGMLAQWIKEGQ